MWKWNAFKWNSSSSQVHEWNFYSFCFFYYNLVDVLCVRVTPWIWFQAVAASLNVSGEVPAARPLSLRGAAPLSSETTNWLWSKLNMEQAVLMQETYARSSSRVLWLRHEGVRGWCWRQGAGRKGCGSLCDIAYHLWNRGLDDAQRVFLLTLKIKPLNIVYGVVDLLRTSETLKGSMISSSESESMRARMAFKSSAFLSITFWFSGFSPNIVDLQIQNQNGVLCLLWLMISEIFLWNSRVVVQLSTHRENSWYCELS